MKQRTSRIDATRTFLGTPLLIPWFDRDTFSESSSCLTPSVCEAKARLKPFVYFFSKLFPGCNCSCCCTDYTHVIFIGTNELSRVIEAITRYTLGGEGYVDPVDFFDVFELDADTGLPSPTFEPMIQVRWTPLQLL